MFENVLGLSISPWLAGITAAVAAVYTYVAFKKVPKCTSQTDLRGKTVIITGANTGVGFATALHLAARNARVILACRSKERGEAAKDKIIAATGNSNIVVRIVDLASLSSVRQFANNIQEEEDRLDILINNAGGVGYPQTRTEDGLEVNMAANHFGHFLLTSLLLDLLKKSAPSRIVNVSSEANRSAKKEYLDIEYLTGEKQQSSLSKYSTTKLANVLFTRELARRLGSTGVSTFSIHPGAVKTDIARNMHWAFMILLFPVIPLLRTPEEGAQTSLYCALAEGIEDLSGKYFSNCALAEHRLNPLANNPELAETFWDVSEKLTKLS